MMGDNAWMVVEELRSAKLALSSATDELTAVRADLAVAVEALAAIAMHPFGFAEDRNCARAALAKLGRDMGRGE